MPSVMQIQKICFGTSGKTVVLLLLSMVLVNSLIAADKSPQSQLRIRAVAPEKAAPKVVHDANIRVTAATTPGAFKPVVRAASLSGFQSAEDDAPVVQDTPLEVATPMPLSPTSILNDRGKLSSKSNEFFKKLTPTDRELLYDGRLPDEFGIGRTYDYVIDGEKITPPENIAGKIFSQEPIENYAYGYHHDWYPMVAAWEAPAFYHRPLYFEEVNLERYGNQHMHLQPVYSAAHFFANTLALPYKMGVNAPCERIYTLGHYRPGDCNPHDRHGLPFSWRGIIYTGAVYSGIGAAFP